MFPIEAAYSKHRRRDVQYLHPDLVEHLEKWLSIKNPEPDEILFPISSASGAVERRTAKMIQFDLEAARAFWIAEAKTEDEERQRLQDGKPRNARRFVEAEGCRPYRLRYHYKFS